MAASTCCLMSQPCGSSLLRLMMARYSPRSLLLRRMAPRPVGLRTEALVPGGAPGRARMM